MNKPRPRAVCILRMIDMNVLVVDIVHFDRERICRALKNTPANVDKVAQFSEVVPRLKNQTYDVIIIGCSSDECQGISLLYELRAWPWDTAPAIVMVSRLEDVDLIQRCLHAGAQDYLFKSEISEKRLWFALANARTRYDIELKQLVDYKKVKHLSETDSLTGLNNRYMFEASLNAALANASRSSGHLEVLLIDLDNFKRINDTHGHDIGDEFLRRVTDNIRSCLRDGELLARLGGDEFALLLTGNEGQHSAARVSRRILDKLQYPITLQPAMGGQVSASIGISLYPEDGTSAEQLLKHADMAMYRAKKQGKNKFCYYTAEAQRRTVARVELENALKSSILDNSLELYFQPVFKQENKVLWGFESLLRWRRNEVLLLPDSFIHIAEETRLIRPIGKWIISSAVHQLKKWQVSFGTDVKMAINLSAVQLEDNHIVPFISSVISKYKIDPQCLEFEITETMLLDHSDHNIQKLQGISNLGCSIALDDFGTGFASISHLQRFPIDVVKIDRSLIPVDEHDEKNFFLSSGLTSMIRSLSLESVAEGVESEAQYECCKKLNVDRLQGFNLSPPLTHQQAGRLIHQLTSQPIMTQR